MVSKKTNSGGSKIVLDELSLVSALKLFVSRPISRVLVLEKVSSAGKVWHWLLQRCGIRVDEMDFIIGHMRTDNGESVVLRAQALSSTASFKAASGIINGHPTLASLNEKYGRNTIQLFVARQIYVHIYYWMVRVLVSQAVFTDITEREIFLKKPLLFDENVINEFFQGEEISFYAGINLNSFTLLFLFAMDYARGLKLIFGDYVPKEKGHSGIGNRSKPRVLLLQEDNIRKEHGLRGQPHWDDKELEEQYGISLVAIKGTRFDVIDDDSDFSGTNIEIFPISISRIALRAAGCDDSLRELILDQRMVYHSLLRKGDHASKHFLIKTSGLLKQARIMGAISIWMNIRLFLVREVYYTFSDAMQLVAPIIGVKTIAYQYSNLGSLSPNMLSTADIFLLFSDGYKKLYDLKEIRPKEFQVTGYLYDGIPDLVRDKAKRHRKQLEDAGAVFVVCYFDESVQHDRWGLVSKEDHLKELHVLAEKVLTDPTFAVVVKSQFIRNSPSQLYSDDDLLKRAAVTGRYLELMEGVHRNDVYPTEAALTADLCISHKFGATAGLEAAIAGVRTVLLDGYGAKTCWEEQYSSVDIEYDSIDALMHAIARYRSGEPDGQMLGDWEAIVEHFDPYRDGKAASRLRKIINEEIC